MRTLALAILLEFFLGGCVYAGAVTTEALMGCWQHNNPTTGSQAQHCYYSEGYVTGRYYDEGDGWDEAFNWKLSSIGELELSGAKCQFKNGEIGDVELTIEGCGLAGTWVRP